MTTVAFENHSLRPVVRYDTEKAIQAHQERLREIAERQRTGAPVISGAPVSLPRIPERSRRTRMEQERCANIEKSNHELLKRIETITFGPGKGSGGAAKKGSLNYERRKKEQDRINRENMKMLKRLEGSKSAFSREALKSHIERHDRLVVKLQSFRPKKGAGDASMDSNQAGDLSRHYSSLGLMHPERGSSYSYDQYALEEKLNARLAKSSLYQKTEPEEKFTQDLPRSISAPPKRASFKAAARLPPLGEPTSYEDEESYVPITTMDVLQLQRKGNDDQRRGSKASTTITSSYDHSSSPPPAKEPAKTFQETLAGLRQQVLRDMQQEERQATRKPLPKQEDFSESVAPRAEGTAHDVYVSREASQSRLLAEKSPSPAGVVNTPQSAMSPQSGMSMSGHSPAHPSGGLYASAMSPTAGSPAPINLSS